VQRSGGTGLLEAPVEVVGLLERARVGDDDGVEGRPGLVVGGDAAEILFDQPPAGEPPLTHRGMHSRDGGFIDHEWRALLRTRSSAEHCDQQ
jgi:hypothetical protein